MKARFDVHEKCKHENWKTLAKFKKAQMRECCFAYALPLSFCCQRLVLFIILPAYIGQITGAF